MKRYSATLTTNATLTIDLSDDQDVELLLIQDATGNRTVTWTGVGAWFTPSGSAPTLRTTAGAADLVTFFQTGGIVYGVHAGDSGPAGSAGSAGPAGITWRGAYGAGTTYAPGDATQNAGSSYFCQLANGPSTTVVAPGSDSSVWSVLCSGGSSTVSGAPIVDTFVRANGLITAGTPPITWTNIPTPSVAITASITSNLAEDDNTAGADCVYRAENVLTSDAHFAQLTLGTWTTAATSLGLGLCVRFSASAQTYYYGAAEWAGTFGQFRILKFVGGSLSATLATVTAASLGLTIASGGVLKFAVSGSTTTALSLSYNGTQVLTATDSSTPITGNVRAGFHTYRNSSAVHASMSDFRYGT